MYEKELKYTNVEAGKKVFTKKLADRSTGKGRKSSLNCSTKNHLFSILWNYLSQTRIINHI